jgi:sporulation protein YlmC with PRC-barrel domain
MRHAYVTSRRYLDSRVQNYRNEELGKVHDVLIDLDTGRVTSVIVAVRGALGLGSRLVVVPFEELQPTYGDQALLWDIPRDEVMARPALDPRIEDSGVHMPTPQHA